MFYFLDTCRHFLFRTTIDNDSALCTKTFGSTNRVHRCITTTDYCYVFTESYRSVRIFTGSVHQINASEVFVGRHDIDGILSRDIHKVRQPGTGSHKYSFETFSFQVLYADCFSYDTVFDEVNTHLAKVLDFYVYNLVGQTEFWNTIFQHTTNLMQCFEYSYIISIFSHISGKCQSCRSRTDYSYFDAVLLCNDRYGDLPAFTFVISCETFQITDSDGLFIHFQMNTF